MGDTLKEIAERLDSIDLILTKLAVFFGTIIIVKALPQLLKINGVVLVILMVLCAARPVYDGWIKDMWSKPPKRR
jgi:hypothetical protein